MNPGASYQTELAQKLQCFFSDQQQGLDIPPAQLYRIEGFIEAGLLAGFITELGLKQTLVDSAKQYLNVEVADFYQQDYRLILHMRMHEAPVYPSSNPPCPQS
ncbi:hypothetical protein [Zhongshania sp.]|uniref:hypothetical protein n=1 Tax=Zhongshania sp. TaxID=1971902 RepID=UPI0035661FE2